MNIKEIFDKAINQHHYVNTAYPLDGVRVWKDYRVKQSEINKNVQAQWNNVSELGLYVHIPFCENRCAYCEYAVLSGEDAEKKDEYVKALLKEIKLYRKFMSGKKLVGFDIGGGTPTVLSVEQIKKIKDEALKEYELDENFAISIETTPKIAALDPEKIRAIREIGIERISMGIQTIDYKLLKEFGREGASDMLIKARDNIRIAGFERFNVDLMYGFAGQPKKTFMATLEFATELNPEYITLYRNRYKGTKLEKFAKDISVEEVNSLYDMAYEYLISKGYKAEFGKNTFSKIEGDEGTSEYLTNRVIRGVPYLGMGLGAQSMGESSIYYNHGAASKQISKYLDVVSKNNFPVQDLYVLPKQEVMAKMISVSFYFGGISRFDFEKRFGIELLKKFKDEIDFLIKEEMVTVDKSWLRLTHKGKDSIAGVIAMFYSEGSKENLLRR